MTRAAALLAVLAGAARAAVETHEVHASGSFGLLRRKHVNPERRLQTDYAPSAAPSRNGDRSEAAATHATASAANASRLAAARPLATRPA